MTHCKKHPDHKTETQCKLCLEPYCPSCTSYHFFVCEGCFYKIMIVLLIVMIVLSYVAWFGIL